MRPVHPHLLARLVAESLLEDLGPGDVTARSVVDESATARAEILARAPMVVAGLEAALIAFRLLDADLEVFFRANDGHEAGEGDKLLEVGGRARALLSAERTALNFLGRLSGIASMARRYVEAASPHKVAISDTRKTTPGLRILEKYAVAVGGGRNHRFGLWDAILIKDNHVDLAGGVARAVSRARERSGGGMPVEVEVRNLEELEEALAADTDAVLLDNFSMADLEVAVERARGRALVEISGGVRLDSVPGLAALGVDRISVGAITHSAPAADLTMRIKT